MASEKSQSSCSQRSHFMLLLLSTEFPHSVRDCGNRLIMLSGCPPLWIWCALVRIFQQVHSIHFVPNTRNHWGFQFFIFSLETLDSLQLLHKSICHPALCSADITYHSRFFSAFHIFNAFGHFLRHNKVLDPFAMLLYPSDFSHVFWAASRPICVFIVCSSNTRSDLFSSIPLLFCSFFIIFLFSFSHFFFLRLAHLIHTRAFVNRLVMSVCLFYHRSTFLPPNDCWNPSEISSPSTWNRMVTLTLLSKIGHIWITRNAPGGHRIQFAEIRRISFCRAQRRFSGSHIFKEPIRHSPISRQLRTIMHAHQGQINYWSEEQAARICPQLLLSPYPISCQFPYSLPQFSSSFCYLFHSPILLLPLHFQL